MAQHCEPAARIVATLGGVSAVAVRTDRDPSLVRKWRLPPPLGTGGVVPENARLILLEMAREQGVPLSYADFAPVESLADTG